MRANEFEQDFDLDKILLELCHHVIKGQRIDSDKYGMVAACVLDPENRRVYGVNEAAADGTRRHAERVAIDRYEKHYGNVPKGSTIITTLSPCNEDMDERYGESCTDLVNSIGCKKVYCGFIDPTQHNDHAEYTLEETANGKIRNLCAKFAKTFLNTK